MKRESSPLQLALFLVLGCIFLRLFNNYFPSISPNVSPLLAIAYVGAMYLPRRWGWLIGPVALLLTDLAFLQINYLTDGSGAYFSGYTVVSCVFFAVFYAAVGGVGLLIARHKSLLKIIGGSLGCSLAFYVAANTFSFWYDLAVGMTSGYPPTLAGWWQANTVGLPGFAPSWVFLRNGMAGDLFFVLLLLLALDRGLLWSSHPRKSVAATIPTRP
jgi:hypothetical protein